MELVSHKPKSAVHQEPRETIPRECLAAAADRFTQRRPIEPPRKSPRPHKPIALRKKCQGETRDSEKKTKKNQDPMQHPPISLANMIPLVRPGCTESQEVFRGANIRMVRQ